MHYPTVLLSLSQDYNWTSSTNLTFIWHEKDSTMQQNQDNRVSLKWSLKPQSQKDSTKHNLEFLGYSTICTFLEKDLKVDILLQRVHVNF